MRSRHEDGLPVLLAVSEAMERSSSTLRLLQQQRLRQPQPRAPQELRDHRPPSGDGRRQLSLHPGLSHLRSGGGARQNGLQEHHLSSLSEGVLLRVPEAHSQVPGDELILHPLQCGCGSQANLHTCVAPKIGGNSRADPILVQTAASFCWAALDYSPCA